MAPAKEYGVDTRYNLGVFWRYVKTQKYLLIVLLVILFLRELATFYNSVAFKLLIDKGNAFLEGVLPRDQFIQFVIIVIASLAAVRLTAALIVFTRSKLITLMETRIMSLVEKDAFKHILNLSYRFHTNKKSGSLISQFTRGVNKTEQMLDIFVWRFFPTIFRLTLTISVVLYFDVLTSIIVAITSILFIIVGVTISNRAKPSQDRANVREDMLKQNLSDVFQNIDTVKYFGKEKRTYSFFSLLSEKLKRARQKSWNYFIYFDVSSTSIVGVGWICILSATFYSFVKGNLSIGSIALIYTAVGNVNNSLYGLLGGYRQFIHANVDVTALYQVFREKQEVVNDPSARLLKVPKGSIEFDNVSFSYKGTRKQELKNFNLKIPKEKKVALVGPSGSGKTTVLRLLYRFFDIPAGTIKIDGQDISKVKQESLRGNMSIVPQEPLLFDNTIYANVAYARPKATRREVMKAMKAARLDSLLKRLPEREKTIIGERGVKLSGGEKQRVSIARALLADKKILVLDEATSALDSETEKEIQDSLEVLMKGRTTIIIAHRLSTIMKADIIVVMEKGKIVEVGNHKELTSKRSGLYKRLWSLQQGGQL